MAHSARAVAIEFIRQGVDAGNPLQIMKLVYLAHGWMLALYADPLVEDTFEAWRYGPVVDALYQAMKGYRADPVTQPIPLPPRALVENGQGRFVAPLPELFSKQEVFSPTLSKAKA